jgi:hypothetical protein
MSAAELNDCRAAQMPAIRDQAMSEFPSMNRHARLRHPMNAYARRARLRFSSHLPEHPELGEAGHLLEGSYDSDLLIAPKQEDLAAILGEAVGQGGAADNICAL